MLSDFEARIAAKICDTENYAGYYFIQTIASSYGLSDHLAQFFHKATVKEIISGVDHGLAWIYNMGLAFVPRAIWQSKPLHYGSVAEQKWLYPDMYGDKTVTTTLPPSFIVDFMFGFGLLSLFPLCFVLGRFLNWVHLQLIFGLKGGRRLNFAFALFVMAYLFNMVRGGTSFLQLIIYMAVILVLMYGFRRLVYSVSRR